MMPTTNRSPLIILGWQTWSILAIVIALVLAAAAYLLLG
jgi:hypothetical protein